MFRALFGLGFFNFALSKAHAVMNAPSEVRDAAMFCKTTGFAGNPSRDLQLTNKPPFTKTLLAHQYNVSQVG